MNQETRRRKIIERVERRGEASIGALAEQFEVSEMTIRRDLDALGAEGRVIRTHGGATASGRVSFEFSFLRRTREHAAEKQQIAVRALELVSDGQSVLLDSGTTTLAVARELTRRRDLTVVTTSLPVASELQYCPTIQVLLLGGYLRSGSPDLSGGLTERNLEALRTDVAFLGADAVDRQGFVYNNSVDLATLLAKMAASAAAVYVVADHTKLGRNGLMQYGALARFAALITDSGAPAAPVLELEANGVTVLR